MVVHLIVTGFLLSKIDVVKSPVITHKETGISDLIKVGKIPADFSSKHFFARASRVLVGSNKYIYVYDDLLTRFFVFNKEYHFISSFCREGQGPGELSASFQPKFFNITYDNRIVVTDQMLKRSIVFDSEGKTIKTYKFIKELNTVYPFLKSDQFFIGASGSKHRFEKIVLLNNKSKTVKCIVTKEDNSKFLLKSPAEYILVKSSGKYGSDTEGIFRRSESIASI